MTRQASDILRLIKNNYFIIGIFFCIVLAESAPWFGARGGPLIPEITVKYFAVFIIFFSSGLTVKWTDLSQAVKQCQINIFIQTISFLFIPLFVQIFLLLFEYFFELNSWIHKGLIIVSCMPPPVSSAVIVVKSIGGNEAAAVFNAALGSFLGMLGTPVLLLIHVGIGSSMPMLKTLFQLIQTMIFPVFLGQVTQKLFLAETLLRIPFSVFGQISLLFIIYTSFCDMFVEEDFNIDAHVILVTIVLVVVLQVILLLTIFQIANYMSRKSKMCTPPNVITITFCSTHKSLTLGMPLLKTLYSGYSHLPQISLPLLIYHPVQLLLGGFLVPYGRKWMKKQMKGTSLYNRP